MNQERRNKRNAQYKINLEKRYGITKKNSDYLNKWGQTVLKNLKNAIQWTDIMNSLLLATRKVNVVTRKCLNTNGLHKQKQFRNYTMIQRMVFQKNQRK